jgi:YD repeat-containing protein
VTYGYSADNLLATVKDAQGNTLLTASYDDYKRAEVVTNGSTATDTKDFNLAARKTDATNERGLSTTQYFDSRYQLLTAVDSLSRQVDYEYQSPFGATKTMDPRGATTNYSYDPLGNVKNVVTQYGDTWGAYYNSANLLSFIHDPTNNGTYRTYDDNKRLKEVYQNAALETDATGNLTGGIVYDTANKIQINYDLNGNIVEVIDAAGNITKAGYDQDGLLVNITSISGRITYYEYDVKARLTRIYDGVGTLISYEYDQDDRLTAMVTPSSRTTYTYDSSGNMISSTDGRGYTTTYQYDQDNNMTHVIDPLGGVTQYTYDDSGNVESIKLANGATLNNLFDVANRKIRKTGF